MDVAIVDWWLVGHNFDCSCKKKNISYITYFQPMIFHCIFGMKSKRFYEICQLSFNVDFHVPGSIDILGKEDLLLFFYKCAWQICPHDTWDKLEFHYLDVQIH